MDSNKQNEHGKENHSMNRIGRFDLKMKKTLNSLASNPQCIEASKKSMAETNHKMNKIGSFDY